MANTYTYDDFLKAAQGQGWSEGNGFSTADWRLAQQNPDAGMSIFNAKRDYINGTTQEQKAEANKRAEAIRSAYGGYTGGTDGSQYYLNKPSPQSFQMTEAPSFSYDQGSDPSYQAYMKQYAREGRRATQETLGNAAAMTGGIPSSYAVAAASQAGDYYAAQAADKVPELYSAAYNRYLNQLNQWNTDRNFMYGQHLDEINSQTQDRQEALQKAQIAAQYGDPRWMEEMGVDMSNDPTKQQWQYYLATLGLDVGDPTLIRQYFGINPNPYVVNGTGLYNTAAYQANMGDPSQLNEMRAALLRGY